MSRLRQTFATGGKKLVAYLTCGDPSPQVTPDLIRAAAAAGADVVELGMPFSDPSADGPAIRLAMQRALERGAGLRSALEAVAAVRAAGCGVPIVLFGYYNPVFVMGVEKFARAAAAAGADGLLLVDCPVDELGEVVPVAAAAGLDVIPLLAPTSSPGRMARVAELGAPFVYYVSMTGVTGAALRGAADLPRRLAEVKAAVRAPVAVGFGIATPADARAVAEGADAVVVGSAIVRAIEQNPGREAEAVATLVGALKRAI